MTGLVPLCNGVDRTPYEAHDSEQTSCIILCKSPKPIDVHEVGVVSAVMDPLPIAVCGDVGPSWMNRNIRGLRFNKAFS